MELADNPPHGHVGQLVGDVGVELRPRILDRREQPLRRFGLRHTDDRVHRLADVGNERRHVNQMPQVRESDGALGHRETAVGVGHDDNGTATGLDRRTDHIGVVVQITARIGTGGGQLHRAAGITEGVKLTA
ncbi:MAG TPA: hypothetical protein VJ914_28915 [Pseudonocardiaceae bacterium]|nr:hypothetical protein [Pseudonocardiaceae bacterium]